MPPHLTFCGGPYTEAGLPSHGRAGSAFLGSPNALQAQMNVFDKRDPLPLFSLFWETTPKIRIHTGSSPLYRLFGKVKRAVANVERGYGIAIPEDKQLTQQLGGVRKDFLKAGRREKRAGLTTRLFTFHLEWTTTDMFSRFRSEDAYKVPTDPRQPRVALTETGEGGKRKADHNSPGTIEQEQKHRSKQRETSRINNRRLAFTAAMQRGRDAGVSEGWGGGPLNQSGDAGVMDIDESMEGRGEGNGGARPPQ
uniref:Uncharacterized protein n=1 Tax=Chromera velia CCMP2878 TaxID=1169474 RepID=A0A0G4I6C3_9ALVE|eukprot:Cvel_1879.t1-p1 / transcript=Cvel_1879.t1 / gene=Cvel_1879 / organism=Chromera_velia_CCMP2878 / gene_product=hypothetical protein / transcript_product=hypothetical protein / location=Cvel_scaffold70:63299-67792(+) / protein_length=251 / sequence_SO=supercontig / SO=protein_coding / is_pseudo=false